LSRRFTEARPPPNPEDLPEDLRKQMEEPVPTKMTELEMAALNGELENIPTDKEILYEHLEIPDHTEEIKNEAVQHEEIKRDKVDINESIQQKSVNAIKQLSDEMTSKQVMQLTEYAKKDIFDITFENGSTRRFYRVGLNEDLTEQIKDVQIELETQLYLETGERISTRELRLKRKKLNKLGLNYLKDSVTHKTMTEDEAKKVTPGSLLTTIIDSCVYRTAHDIVDPKV